jgi:hypothetical protein
MNISALHASLIELNYLLASFLTHALADLTFGLGTVVHDYLKP